MGYNSTFVVNNVMVTTPGDEENPDDGKPVVPGDQPDDPMDDSTNGSDGDRGENPSDTPADPASKEKKICVIGKKSEIPFHRIPLPR